MREKMTVLGIEFERSGRDWFSNEDLVLRKWSAGWEATNDEGNRDAGGQTPEEAVSNLLDKTELEAKADLAYVYRLRGQEDPMKALLKELLEEAEQHFADAQGDREYAFGAPPMPEPEIFAKVREALKNGG